MPRITTTAIDLAIAERITTLRKELGITQAQLADAIGVTFQQVQKYEKGQTICHQVRRHDFSPSFSDHRIWELGEFTSSDKALNQIGSNR